MTTPTAGDNSKRHERYLADPAARHAENIRRAAHQCAEDDDLKGAKALKEAARWIEDHRPHQEDADP